MSEQRSGSLRYRKIGSFDELVFERQSDFSPKEIYYPVNQTLLTFVDGKIKATEIPHTKKNMIFMRACDIHALKRLDRIFLENGSKDYYYGSHRDNIVVVLMECEESGPDCFCVSMGTNESCEYSLAIRKTTEGCFVHLKDSALYHFLKNEQTVPYHPEFIKNNQKEISITAIKDLQQLCKISQLDFWKKFNDKCISCGGCNMVCGSCSCFDTLDVTYDETGKNGERRRIWSSCMLSDFTMTAGGNCVRKTPGEAMRFKIFHKLFDYSIRFGANETLCVGCGRCIRKCHADIDFSQTITEMYAAIKEGDYA